MSRWRAAGIHLTISLIVVGLIIAFLLLTWYPPIYARMGKLTQLVSLIGGIDLVLGPLLTLVVFKSGKPKLKLDLAIIALLQVSAMAYGLNVLWQSRPVFLVAVPDRFELVYANEIDPSDLAAGSRPEFRELSLTGPRLVGAQLPIQANESYQLTLMAVEGRDIQALPKYYVDYDAAAPVLASHGLPLTPGSSTPPVLSAALLDAAKRANRDASGLTWVPISSRRGTAAAMIIDARTGAMITPVDVDPWANDPQPNH